MPSTPGQPSRGGGGATTRPTATTTYDPAGPGIVQVSGTVVVRRDNGTPLPNLVCDSISWREFDPPTAQFRYLFGTRYGQSPYDPTRIEQVFPLTSKGPRVAKIDDRIQVVRIVGKTETLLWDGFVPAPQANIGDTESCAITGIGTPIREWDNPLGGARMRDNDGLYSAPAVDGVDPAKPQDVDTDEATQFNPDDKPNCTPKNWDSQVTYSDSPDGQPTVYPVFVDPTISTNFPDAKVRLWVLGTAARYIIRVGNPDRKYVKTPTTDNFTTFFQAAIPDPPVNGLIDWADPTTYKLVPIPVQDIDITGDAWPDALRRLIEPHGFAFRWTLTTKSKDVVARSGGIVGSPVWGIDIYRKDDVSRLKTVTLQKAGSNLLPRPGKSNLASASLVRDTAGIVNAFVAATDQVWYEASFILSPGFAVGSIPDPKYYVRGQDGSTTAFFDPNLFRRFVFGEGGDPYWSYRSGSLIGPTPTNPATPPTDLQPLFFPDDDPTDPRRYVHRRRKTKTKMISRDAFGDPFESRLEVSVNYSGATPGLWDQKAKASYTTATIGGDWQLLGSGAWRPLDDQIGIEFSLADPRSVPISPGPQSERAAFAQGSISIPDCVIAAPATAGRQYGSPARIAFRYTTQIQGDHWLKASVIRRNSSPTKFQVKRYDDTRDRFEKKIISRFSMVNVNKSAPKAAIDIVDVDDTVDAKNHCQSRQRAHESGKIAGHCTVPYFTDVYSVGDKMSKIAGREISLALNANIQKGESPTYPVITSIDYSLQSVPPTTTMTWGDARSIEPPSEHRRRVRE